MEDRLGPRARRVMFPLLAAAGLLLLLSRRRQDRVPVLPFIEPGTPYASSARQAASAEPEWMRWDRIATQEAAAFADANARRMATDDPAEKQRLVALYDLHFQRYREARNRAIELRGPG